MQGGCSSVLKGMQGDATPLPGGDDRQRQIQFPENEDLMKLLQGFIVTKPAKTV